MRRNRILAACALALFCAVPGCVGSFAVTRTVYKKNVQIENRAAREGLFLALLIVPVYPVALLGDLLIFNTIELFGGENPMADEHDLDADTRP
jgi:hypothetical protein